MANIHISFEHYLAKGQRNRLELLMKPDEIPESLDTPVLWRCRMTGEIFAKSYHALPNKYGEDGKYGSHGQQYWNKYKKDYLEIAKKLGITFLYDETVDLAPAHSRQDVKWRGRNGQIVVTSLHKLKFGKIPRYLQQALGLLTEGEAVS